MKYILGLFCLLFLMSCDNELDLVSEFKEVPVVYGLIDISDTAQYIRVERAFADRNKSANEIAQNPDSLYYNDISVKLVNKTRGEEYFLERVDGNVEGYFRDEGIFAQSPNYLYKKLTNEMDIQIGDSVQLQIGGVFDDRLVTSDTDIFEEPFFVTPNKLGFERNKKVVINWKAKPDPTIYAAAFYFNITEINDGEVTEKRLRWPVLFNSEEEKLEVQGESFFTFLKSELEENSSIIRIMNLADFELTSGNQSVADYIRVGQANLGITSSGEIPIFSNISDGLGIFGSKYVDLRKGIDFRQVTRDSLRNSVITEALNFQ